MNEYRLTYDIYEKNDEKNWHFQPSRFNKVTDQRRHQDLIE